MLIDKKLSKMMSHALRHAPWVYELELDDEGWVELDALVAAAREASPEWSSVTRDDVLRVVAGSSKRRFESTGDRVRALYGHSIPGKLRRERAAPPPVLFHGTAPETAQLILADGLRPMARQYVHLSADTATALEVGRRKHPRPTLLEVDAASAHAAGVAFYLGNEKVWLADFIPTAYLKTRRP